MTPSKIFIPATFALLTLANCNADSRDNSSDEAQASAEIFENLRLVGYPESEIALRPSGEVIVGGDAVVSLQASREMVAQGFRSGSVLRQYRTNNLVDASNAVICVDGSTFTGTLSDGLDQALANYNALDLAFEMVRTAGSSAGCDATIVASVVAGSGGSAGFPAEGAPYASILIGADVAISGIGVTTHVIAHELGHCVGLRHSDYYDRSISCGWGGNEGDAGVGAQLVPGTPSVATLDGSVMNSCYNYGSTGVFTSTDVTALTTLYGDLAHCDSGMQDGDETDLDCGGSCDSCSTGQACVDNSDCVGGLCSAGVCAVPEVVCEGNFYLSSKNAFNQFVARGCTQVTGKLNIYGSSGPMSLVGLESLWRVGGELSLGSDLPVQDFTGLSGLTEVGSLQIAGPVLTSFEGLNALEIVHGNMRVVANTVLQDLRGLDSLNTVEGELRFDQNPSLRSVSLPSLTSVGSLNFMLNPKLADVSGLAALSNVAGNVYFGDNPALKHLRGFEGLTSVGGTFSMYRNASLRDLSGLDGLSNIGQRLVLVENRSLQSLRPLHDWAPSTVQSSLEIRNNANLAACEATNLDLELNANCGWYCTGNTGAGSCAPDLTCTGDYYLSSQQAFDQFVALGCTEVQGSLHIYSANAPTSLVGLERLRRVSGELFLGSGLQVADFSGLSGIESVGSLTVSAPALTSFAGLGALETVQGDARIAGNSVLTNLAGLDSLTTVAGELSIDSNPALTNFASLPALTAVGHLKVLQNPALINLAGFESLATVVGNIDINFCDALHDVTGLDGLREVGGWLDISVNQTLQSLDGLSSLQSVGDRLIVMQNPALLELDTPREWDASTVAGRLEIYSNANLSACEATSLDDVLDANCSGYCYSNNGAGTCDTVPEAVICEGDYFLSSTYWFNQFALRGCTEVTGDLNIYSSNGPTSLVGLENLRRVHGKLSLSSGLPVTNFAGLSGLQRVGALEISSPTLTSLAGLHALKRVDAMLRIVSNASLTNLAGLDSLTTVTGQLSIESNPVLSSLGPMPALTSVGSLKVLQNNQLGHLVGLESLRKIVGGVDIFYSPALVDLAGLGGVTSIGGSLAVTSNALLSSFSGLDALSSLGIRLIVANDPALTSLGSAHAWPASTLLGSLEIYNNASLPACEVTSLDQGLLANCTGYCFGNAGTATCE